MENTTDSKGNLVLVNKPIGIESIVKDELPILSYPKLYWGDGSEADWLTKEKRIINKRR